MKTLLPAALLLLAATTNAWADDAPTGPTPSQKAAAIQRFEKGVKLLNRGEQRHDSADYEAAYTEFAQAWAIYPDSKVLWNLAVSEVRTKRYVDALRHLREYDRRERVTPAHRHFGEFTKDMDEASNATAHLEIEAPRDAHVLVDGAVVGKAPLDQLVDTTPGEHRVTAHDDSRADASTTVTAPAGTVTHVRLAAPAAPPPAVAAAVPAPPVTTQAIVASPSPPREDRAANDAPFLSGRRVAGLVVAGAGIVSLGASVAFAAKSNDEDTHAAAITTTIPSSFCGVAPTSPSCADLASTRDAQRTDHTLSIAFGVVGGAALVTGAVLFLLPQSTDRATKTAFVPFFTPNGGGVSLGGEL